MELNLSGKWKMVPDLNNTGETEKWHNSNNFPKIFQIYHSPGFWFSHPFENIRTAWLKKDFVYHNENKHFAYLVFFGIEQGKIWLNGEYLGDVKRTSEKQYFEISNKLKENNTLVIKLENLEAQSLGIWKYVYITEETTIPNIAKTKADYSPKWLDSAVIYSIYTRNFSEEGTFERVSKSLSRLKSLGVNTLWFLPIQPVGEIGKKGSMGSPYSIKDYYAIDPLHGSADDFKALVEKAHSMDMKVILDLVINHTSIDSVMVDEDDKYYKPANEDNANKWGWTDVRELDYSYQPTREYIKKMMGYWIQEFDLDGFRCDVAFLVPEDFWRESIDYIRAIKKDIIMLAEADNPELYACGFDLTYDWLFAGICRWISSGYLDFEELFKYIQTQYEYFPQNSKRLIFVENHDIDRAASAISEKYQQIFQLIKYISPGIPLIYNGEEIGASKTPSLFEKDAIDWKTKDTEMQELYKSLSKLKKKNTALHYHRQGSLSIQKRQSELFLDIQRSSLDKILDISINTKTFDAHIREKKNCKQIIPASK